MSYLELLKLASPEAIVVLTALIVLSIGPIIMGIYHIGFERRRWSESMFGSSGNESDIDYSGDDD